MKQKKLLLLIMITMFGYVAGYGQNIVFSDENVKQICVKHWDMNGDKELSKGEAACVRTFRGEFAGNDEIVSFDELKFFTGLDQIGRGAFRDCNNLTAVAIPENVEWIGDDAFNCKNLKKVTIPKSVKKNRGRGLWGGQSFYLHHRFGILV